MTIETKKWEDRMVEIEMINNKEISYSDRQLLVFLQINPYLLTQKVIYYLFYLFTTLCPAGLTSLFDFIT